MKLFAAWNMTKKEIDTVSFEYIQQHRGLLALVCQEGRGWGKKGMERQKAYTEKLGKTSYHLIAQI